MRRLLFVIAALVAAFAVAVVPAGAITDGELDGDGHPAVVLVLMEVNGAPAFRCTGTLIAPTFVLTAGHCAGEPGEFSGIRVFTESDVQNGSNNYPFAGPNAVEAVRWAAHPEYTNAAFFLHDVGMIELAQPVNLDPDDYGDLPTTDQLDVLTTQRGRQDVTFTSVGYGRQLSFPPAASWKNSALRIRMVAHPKLDQINGGIVGDFAMLLSNNAATGGTCFGDSGGANYLGTSNVIAGVTSFGLNRTCGGTGGVFRVDRENVLAFIADFMSS